jgi:O-antigen/teichoic acid export membrane protein
LTKGRDAHYRDRFKKLQLWLRFRTLWQAAIFTVSNILVSLLGVVSTAILARHLSTLAFGSYAFSLSLLQLAAIVFEFGLFASAARLVALEATLDRREVIGAALLLYLPVGVAFSLFVFASSFGVDAWFHTEAGTALRIAAPIAIAIPFAHVLQQLAQGAGRLHVASISALLMQVLLVALLAVFVGLGGELTTGRGLVLRCSAALVAALAAALWLRPLFRHLRRWLMEILVHTRDYGFQVYVGRLLSIGTYNMDVLMIGALANVNSVGFYTLAGSVAAAAGLPVMGMSAALFARMARTPRIKPWWLYASIGIGGLTTLTAWALASTFVSFAFSSRYGRAADLVLPLALAQAVRGVTSIYNTFLFAHGRGRELRNAGLVLTGSNIAFNFTLIPPFGAMGAAWASLFALIVNLIAHVIFYRRSLRRPD